MADATDPQLAAELKKKRTFRTFSYRGIELEKLLDLSNEEVRTFNRDPVLFHSPHPLCSLSKCVPPRTPWSP